MDSLTLISGTNEDDVLAGTSGTDVLLGGNGDDLLDGGAGDDLLLGGNGDDTLLGGTGDDLLLGGNGDDVLDGGDGDDLLTGGNGDDVLNGGDGYDLLLGGNGDDFLDGGAGNDWVYAGQGYDVALYSMAGNLSADFADIGTRDSYDGGSGFDTLRLALTSGELLLASVQQDIAAFEAFLAQNANACGDTGPAFEFTSFDLSVRDFEKLDILLVNSAPTARGDSGATDEDTLLLVSAPGVLANDTDADHLDVLAITGADAASARGAVVLVGADAGFSYDPTAVLALQQLAEGETTTDSFSYTIADLAGETSTATVEIVVTGVNDAPVAFDDSNSTNEDSPIIGNVLANDSDVDNGDSFSVGAVNGQAANVGTAITLASGALLTVDTAGNYSYDPNGSFETLGVGKSAFESFTYVITDSHGATSDTATVDLTVTGVNDAPVAVDDVIAGTVGGGGGPIRVAVIGGPSGTFGAAAGQLNDETNNSFDLDATAIEMNAALTKSDWTAMFAAYDVVVIGENGTVVSDYDGSQIFAALRDFVDAGGGVVTTGWFAGEIAAYTSTATQADADYISPSAPFGESLYVGSGSTITFDPSLLPHPIAGDFLNYTAQSLHEVAGAVDGSATVLATNDAGLAAIAYDEVGPNGGLTVFLGSLHMGNAAYALDGIRIGAADQIFEQAVAWAAGEQDEGTATTDEDHAVPIDVLANDTDIDFEDILTVTPVSATSTLGAALSVNADGDIVYDPTSALQGLAAGEIANDSFWYEVSDGNGGTDTARVDVTVAGLADLVSGSADDSALSLAVGTLDADVFL